jgi:predicted Zn-dependent protease
VNDDRPLNEGLTELSPAWQQAAQFAVSRATALGAHAADAYLEIGRTTAVEIDESHLRHGHVHEEQSLSLRAIADDGAAGMVWLHGSATRRQLERLAEQAVTLMRSAHAMPGFTGLPGPGPRPEPKGMSDPALADLTPASAVLHADRQRLAVLEREPSAIVAGSLTAWMQQSLLVNSAGLHLDGPDTRFELAIDVTLPGDELSMFGEETFGCEMSRLESADTAKRALAGARAFQGRRPGKTGRTTVVLGPWASAALMEAVAEAASAEWIQQRTSWLTDQKGQRIAGGEWTIIDDPLADAGYHSGAFDDDGAVPQTTAILQAGRFANPLHNLWTAGRNNATNTGHGTRSRHVESTNLRSLPGDMPAEQLINQVRDGVYLDDVSFDVELATGEFATALGYARQIEDGQITQGLDGLLWTGHVLDVLSHIEAISQDGRSQPGLFWPSIRIHGASLTSGS